MTGGLEEFETEDLLASLHGLSLLLERDLGQGFFRLHDTVRQYLRDSAGNERLIVMHKALIGSLDGAAEAAEERTRRYFYRSLAIHLAEAGEREKLDVLLLNPAWLKAKLDVTRNPLGLFLDYQQYGIGEAQSLIGRTLRLISGILARDPSQLLPQLIGRMTALETAPLPGFVEAARARHLARAIVPLRPGLIRPGAETARLKGHTDWVHALCLLPDGRLASGSWDRTIRLWDFATGAETARLEGHTASVHALCALPDGRLASGSRDHTIILWDLVAGKKTARLAKHWNWVEALCLLPDGRLASGSRDGTIRLWDVATGAETACLEGHSGSVNALCLLADGRLASGSGDGTIRLWDVATGVTACLEVHSGSVIALCLLPDGRLAAGSGDNTIRLLDLGDRERDRPSRWAYRSRSSALPAGGRAARLGLYGQHDPAVGYGDGHRDGLSRGAFKVGSGPLPAAGRAARLRLWGQYDPAVGRGEGGADRPSRWAFRLC